MNKKFFAIILSMIFLSACNSKENYNDLKASESLYISQVEDSFYQPSNDRSAAKEWAEVKSIFLTGNTLGYKPRFNKIMKLVDNSEINSLVIDVKDDFGHITYDSTNKTVKEIGADLELKDPNFNDTMDMIIRKDIYPIARIVTFKDRTIAGEKTELAIKDKSGQVWRDNKGDAWLNPYNKKSWEYPIELAEEAALKGFKEIQFDYVRFPTDGNRELIDYGDDKEKSMAEAIADFLKYARERLSPYGVVVSADVFGLVTTSEDDMNLGQHLETLATSVDIICPMVYPSHYDLGSYGVAYPDKDPYAIVKHSMEVAKERIDKLETNEKKAILRPWLQDFSAPWLKSVYGSNYIEYGPNEIKAQKQATYDVGINEWIFWNAGNVYTEGGY